MKPDSSKDKMDVDAGEHEDAGGPSRGRRSSGGPD